MTTVRASRLRFGHVTRWGTVHHVELFDADGTQFTTIHYGWPRRPRSRTVRSDTLIRLKEAP